MWDWQCLDMQSTAPVSIQQPADAVRTERQLWNKRYTARFLNISIDTLDRLLARGEGPKARRIGSQIRFVPADVQVFLDSCATVGRGEVTSATE
jgi:predicted DNA-binding transcriptional regulator AlpA